MMNIAGKTLLLTGATGGIGRAIAHSLACGGRHINSGRPGYGAVATVTATTDRLAFALCG